MTRLRLIALLSLTAIAGCSSAMPTPEVTEPPTPEISEPPVILVPLAVNRFGSFNLLVRDNSGLVVRALGRQVREGVTEEAAVAAPEVNEIRVIWVGGACAHQPILTLSGVADDLELVLAPDPPPHLPVDCPAIGLIFEVALALSEPVEQEALALEVME